MMEQDRLRLAQYAYHACEFISALHYLADAGSSAAAICLRIKCLYESELNSAACAEADLNLGALGANGVFHYYRGVAHYHRGSFEPDEGASLRTAIDAFKKASALGFGGGELGMAMVALAGEDFARATALLDQDLGLAGELEHVRLRVLALAAILQGAYDRAEVSLLAAARVIATTPSMLLRAWGDIGWSHLHRVRGKFDLAAAILDNLRPQITREATPRLFEALHEEDEALVRHDRQTTLQMPVQGEGGGLPVEELRALGKKRVLASLYHALVRAGHAGISRHELVRQLWNEDYEPRAHDERLHKSINRLRQILEQSAAELPPVLTQQGARYVLAAYRDWRVKYGPTASPPPPP
jgi:hypothetical protein